MSMPSAMYVKSVPLLLQFKNIQGHADRRDVLRAMVRVLRAAPHIEDENQRGGEEGFLCTEGYR